jgi:acyl-CoA thioesterase I
MIKMKTCAFLIFAAFLILSCEEKKDVTQKSQSDSLALKKDPVKPDRKTIVFFGNSITAGYGLDMSAAFPARIQDKIDSLNMPYTVVNAGVSGETSAGGNSRIDWILKQPVDVFVLELGGNDGLRGIPISETRKNLQGIIDKVKAKNPEVKIVLAGMQIPPNMGKRYTTEFRNMYPELARENNTALVPFILEGVGGRTEMNLEDGIHPSAEGHRILADNVWSILEPLL